MNNDWGCKVTPQMVFTVKSLINSQICYHYKIKIAYSRNMKICNKTKLGVLNPNPWSEMLYQETFENFQNEAVSWKGVLNFHLATSHAALPWSLSIMMLIYLTGSKCSYETARCSVRLRYAALKAQLLKSMESPIKLCSSMSIWGKVTVRNFCSQITLATWASKKIKKKKMISFFFLILFSLWGSGTQGIPGYKKLITW